MYIKKIYLNQFKNYNNLRLDFSDGINCFTGLNGSGKTNLLDAIYYLALTKSAFNALDSQSVAYDTSFFSIEGEFEAFDKDYTIRCSFQKGQKKRFSNNGALYERLSKHIGLIPIVMIAPQDADLIQEGSEVRRKFFDGILAQSDTIYLEKLLLYQKLLKQRNALLKQFAQHNFFDKTLLTSFDERLIKYSKTISQKRQAFIISFTPIFKEYYTLLTQNKEEVSIKYISQATDDNFEYQFYQYTSKDIASQRTNLGTHKDDYLFEMNARTLKTNGSQGQKKSFVIALKLAQFHFLKDLKSTSPILLLDDLFEKLDENRIKTLLELVTSLPFGQLFITDTNLKRCRSLVSSLPINKKFIEIKDGVVDEVFGDIL